MSHHLLPAGPEAQQRGLEPDALGWMWVSQTATSTLQLSAPARGSHTGPLCLILLKPPQNSASIQCPPHLYPTSCSDRFPFLLFLRTSAPPSRQAPKKAQLQTGGGTTSWEMPLPREGPRTEGTAGHSSGGGQACWPAGALGPSVKSAANPGNHTLAGS